jgi:hypothetical protein
VHSPRGAPISEAWIYLANRLRKKRPVRSPQVPSSKTAGRKEQQGKPTIPSAVRQPVPAARLAADVSPGQMPPREVGATADVWEPAGRELSAAFLLQLEESLQSAGRDQE